jgi:hypothetical protein
VVVFALKRRRIDPIDTDDDSDDDEPVTIQNDRAGKKARRTSTSETIEVLMTDYQNIVCSRCPEIVAPSSVLSTVQGIRRLLLGLSKAEEEASLQKFLVLGLFPFVTHTLETWGTATPVRDDDYDDDDDDATNHSIVYEALWILVDLSSRNAKYTHNVAGLGAVTMPKFIKFLDSKQPANIREQATWLLANLASDCDEFRRQLWSEPIIIQALCDSVSNVNGNLSLVTTTVWAIGNVLHSNCGTRTGPPTELVLQLVPIVKAAYTCLAAHCEASIIDLVDPVMAVGQIIQLGDEARQAVYDTGLVSTLVRDIEVTRRKPHSDKFVALATRTVALFLKGSSEDEARKIVGSQKFLTLAIGLLKSRNVRLTKVSARHAMVDNIASPFSPFPHFKAEHRPCNLVAFVQHCRARSIAQS